MFRTEGPEFQAEAGPSESTVPSKEKAASDAVAKQGQHPTLSCLAERYATMVRVFVCHVFVHLSLCLCELMVCVYTLCHCDWSHAL